MTDSPRRDLNSNDPADLPPLADVELHIPDYPVMVPEPAPGGAVIRAVPYLDELNARGFVITCPECKARRDWLLLETRSMVFVRCRCGHEWREREVDVEFFEENFAYPERSWQDAGDAMVALGFSGEFRGIYFN
ncbi:hypothetical protein [Kitasatospora sp. NPDC017646]|uniref:hypothetical protein n=1 Tax=Kitasatospora sp. NPDC017646 TaxID=3364024 RepID=UPI0037AFA5DC